jgi:opacity protein-like surface antigen
MRLHITAWVACAALHAGTAIAAEAQPAPAVDAAYSDEWKFSVSPYLWAPALSGKLTHRRLPPVDFDASFDKIFDNLDFAAMLMGDARKGRYSIFGDLLYVKVGAQGDTPRDLLATSVDVKNESFTGMIGAGYSVLDRSEHSLDVVGGLRVWSVDTDIRFKGRLGDTRKFSDSATWVDAMVGVRGTYNFHSKAYLTGWGMIGAGGAQADWDLGLGVGYNFNKSVSATLGYRAMGVDYERNGFKYDVVLQGPIAGLTIRF